MASDIDRTAQIWNGEKFVTRKPYYANYENGFLTGFHPHPWHFIMFSQFRPYRFFVGGVWHHLEKTIWVRMEDRQRIEWCDDHCEMAPCEYCARMDDDYGA